jgi:hypothetical protein
MTDILDDCYESDLTDEEHERLILMSEHAIAKPLSPAAQAVLAAYRSTHLSINNLAAALRAVAQQAEDLYCADLVVDDSDGAVFVLRQLMLIADELEAL